MGDNSRAFNLLAVDDSEDFLALVDTTLRGACNVKRAQDGPSALRLALEMPHPDLILLDIEMPGLSGYDVCKAIKANPALADVPVIFLTQHGDAEDVIQGFQLGAIDYLTKPINARVLAARIRAHIELITRRNRQEDLILEGSVQLEHARLQLIRRLGRAMEYHETSAIGNRVVRLGHYARHLAEAAGAKAALCDLMMRAAPLHDIGKLGVPAHVLRKTEKLSAPERAQMQRHAEIGAEIIGEHDDPLLKLARTLALTHHERWDGTGYPSGAAGNDIPWSGRVMAVVDAFEGMTATQFHHEPMRVDIAADVIIRGAGRQFDPQIVEAFKKALPAFRNVRETYSDELGDILNLDFVASPPSARAPAMPDIGTDEALRTAIGTRALQALRDSDEARAKALAGARARLTAERELAAAAAQDLSTQQAARKLAEEAAAREAELLELTMRRVAEESAAASAARERAKADADAAAAARRTEQVKAQLVAELEARAIAEQAQASAAQERRDAEEALAKTEEKLASAQAQTAQAELWPAEDAPAVMPTAQEQTESQAHAQVEETPAAGEAQPAGSDAMAPHRTRPAGRRTLVFVIIAIVIAAMVAAVAFLI